MYHLITLIGDSAGVSLTLLAAAEVTLKKILRLQLLLAEVVDAHYMLRTCLLVSRENHTNVKKFFAASKSRD